MDTTPIAEALKVSLAIISSHGITAHMSNRSTLSRQIDSTTKNVRFDFSLDPSRSPWADGNSSCSLIVGYNGGANYAGVDGGTYNDFKRSIKISYSSDELRPATARLRENMMNSLLMVCEMLEASLPKSFTITMVTPAEALDRAARASEQEIAKKIFDVVGSDAVKNLRKGGKGRIVRVPEAYVQNHGDLPPSGDYRLNRPISYDRRGYVRQSFDYVVKVSTSDGSSTARFYKV